MIDYPRLAVCCRRGPNDNDQARWRRWRDFNLGVLLAGLFAALATISAAPAATMIEDAASACGGLVEPSPLARGFVTYGTDLGHETKPGEPPQVFALNDKALRILRTVHTRKCAMLPSR